MSTVQSYLAASGSAVALRMEEMRQKEAREKESAAAAAAEKLAELRRTVEIASIDWEAEVLLAIEKIPGLLDAVRPMVLAGVQRRRHVIGKEGICWTDSSIPCRRYAPLFHPKCLYEEPCPVLAILRGIHYGFTEADVSKESTLLCEQARFRVRLLTRVFHSLQEQVVAIIEVEKAAKSIEKAAQAAEEARVAAEKKALAAAAHAAAMEEQRIRMNDLAAKSLADHPHFRILLHNYTDYETPETLFAAYKECKHTGRRWLHVRRLMMGHVQEAHVRPSMCDFSGSIGPAPPISVPSSWASHYETGKVPFLTVCPVCHKSPKMHSTQFDAVAGGIGTPTYSGGQVECTEHYKWEALTNTHYKWARMPPRPTYMNVGFYPDGHWVLWDPKDPDGSKAAQAAKDKQVAEKEEKIRKLQEELLSLR